MTVFYHIKLVKSSLISKEQKLQVNKKGDIRKMRISPHRAKAGRRGCNGPPQIVMPILICY